VDLQALDHGRLFGRNGRKQNSAAPLFPGEPGHRECASHRAGGAGEREFAGDQPLVETRRVQLRGGREDGERDGQVVTRALLPYITRG
jgi:hypothetical protein